MSEKIRVVKYIIVNGVMTLFYFVLYYILEDIFKMDITLANLISYVFSMYVAYQLTKKYVFLVEKKSSKYIVLFTMTRIGMIALNSGGHYILVSKVGINQYVSLVIMTMICFLISYIINKAIFNG